MRLKLSQVLEGDSTAEIGSKIIYLETVDSTNNYAAKLRESGSLTHGTVILAEEQTNGRGQRGNSWQSEGGKNISLSIYLEPENLNVDDQKQLNYVTSLAVLSALKDYEIEATVKWPNDIYIGNQKIAGILIESQLKSSQISHAIIGLGLNVLQTEFGIVNATSLVLNCRNCPKPNEFAADILKNFNSYYQTLKFRQFKVLEKLYLQNMLGFEKVRRYKSNNEEFEAVAKDISQNGALGLQIGSEKKYFQLKEIEYLFD